MLKDAWTLAIETLIHVELRKLNEREALAQTSEQLGITNPNTVRYAYKLVIETVRRKNLIDQFINSVLKPKTLSAFGIGVQMFLSLYVHQTRIAKDFWEPDVEEAARIAKLARAILGWKTIRVVEPFLGFLLTQKIEPVVEDAAKDEERIALRTFHPTWFVEYCFRLLGRKEAIAFLESSICPPPVFVRLNTLRASQKEIVSKLETEGVKLKKTELLRHTYKVTQSRRPLTKIASYQEGLFYVQDKASCFAAEAADSKSGMTMLDVCAAPGAKTTYLAQLMQNQGKIFSFDYSARRMKTWKQEIQRMGTEIAEPVIADTRISLPLNVEAGLVVLDPPCTSTGVFGRQPSAKWRITPKSVETMAEIQWRMINNVAENVMPGGVLTYSTCSVTLEENELIIARFLKWHPEFYLAEITPKLGLPGLRGLTKCRRLYPNLHESNGFFIAKLKKEMDAKT